MSPPLIGPDALWSLSKGHCRVNAVFSLVCLSTKFISPESCTSSDLRSLLCPTTSLTSSFGSPPCCLASLYPSGTSGVGRDRGCVPRTHRGSEEREVTSTVEDWCESEEPVSRWTTSERQKDSHSTRGRCTDWGAPWDSRRLRNSHSQNFYFVSPQLLSSITKRSLHDLSLCSRSGSCEYLR